MKIVFFLVSFSLLIVACQPAVSETLPPATEIISTITLSPVPSITPSPTEEPLTIEKLASVPAAERKQMMLEATGIDFMISDETPHLGFEVVQGEDGAYSIGRVYNIITGEMVEVPQRADNVGSDTFTYVEQDWQGLDQESLGHVQVFPRVDGKGVVVLKMPAQYAVFSDDPSTPDVREFVTTKADEQITKIELPTFVSFDEAIKYAIFVKGARHDRYESAKLKQNPEVYNSNPGYFYGGMVVVGGDVSTPDGKITFGMGVRLLPSGDLIVSFGDIHGVLCETTVNMVNGLDSNGYSVQDIMDIVKTAIGDPSFLSTRNNQDAQNTLPTIPDDFDY